MDNLPSSYDKWRTYSPEFDDELPACPCCHSRGWDYLFWSEKDYAYIGCTDCLEQHDMWEVAEKGVLNAED